VVDIVWNGGEEMESKITVFDFQAEATLTKQLGGRKATEELIGLCHIEKDKYVLEVGCGVGLTACYIARKYGCRIVGVDISEKMIERSKERAGREGVEDRVEFRVADVQDLPFEDGLFDVVIGESITVFPEDKQKAVSEYVRVTKPGGYVGLNETTWLKTPVPMELVEWVSCDYSANAEVLPADAWVGLLEGAGLRDIIARTYKTSALRGFTDLVGRYGLGEMLGVWRRALSLYRTSPAYKRFVREIKEAGPMPKGAFEYFGYGIYVGRK
jgi:arsenite methyltransferase